MEKENKNIHRGKVLHDALRQHPRKIKEIVKDAGYQYGTFYKHAAKEDLSYEIIAKYGKAINKDFSVEFPEMNDFPSLAIVERANMHTSSIEIQNELNDLREKYSHFLNKHNLLLEANIELREENIRLKEEIADLKSKLMNKD